MSSCLDYEFIVGFEDQSGQACELDDWQQINYKSCQESNAIWKEQVHWHRVSFFAQSSL